MRDAGYDSSERQCSSTLLGKNSFRMRAENPTWGAPRIHGEPLKLGFELSETIVPRWIRRAPTKQKHEPALCSITTILVRERTEGVDRNLSDLKIQALLDSMIASHQLQTPIANAVYVLFLASNLQSKIGEQQSDRDFLAYHNHFHAKAR